MSYSKEPPLSYPPERRTAKIAALGDDFGMTVNEMIQQGTMDSVCPAICMNLSCNYTTEMEPDQDQGFCENCKSNTVQSALVLLGMI